MAKKIVHTARVAAVWPEDNGVEGWGGGTASAFNIKAVRRMVEAIEQDGGVARIYVNGVLVQDFATFEAMAIAAQEG